MNLTHKWIFAASIVSLVCSCSPGAFAASPEFLITPDKVVSLRHPEVSIKIGQPFDRDALLKSLPGYRFDQGVEEGQTVWYLSSDRDKDGQPMGGIGIYLDGDKELRIDSVGGGEGVFDSAGATTGISLTNIFRKGSAKCENETPSCVSEISPSIVYIMDIDGCADSVGLGNYGVDHKPTKLDKCMKIYSIQLSKQK